MHRIPGLLSLLRPFPLESAQERIQVESYKTQQNGREINTYLNVFALSRETKRECLDFFFKDLLDGYVCLFHNLIFQLQT